MNAREWVREQVAELTTPSPDGGQTVQSPVWASKGMLINNTRKGGDRPAREAVEAAIYDLDEAGELFYFHGLLAPATEEHLRAIIANENQSDLPRKILIERARDAIQHTVDSNGGASA